MVSHGELPAKKFNQVNTRSDQRVLEANNFRNRFTSFRSGSLTGFHGPSLSREQATHGSIQSNCSSSLRSQAPLTPPTIINIFNFDFNKLWIFITLCHPRVQQALTSGIKFPTNANPAISVQMQTQIQIVQIPVRCKHKKQAGDLPQREGLVFSQIQIPSAAFY